MLKITPESMVFTPKNNLVIIKLAMSDLIPDSRISYLNPSGILHHRKGMDVVYIHLVILNK